MATIEERAMKDIEKRANDMTVAIKGGYVPEHRLKSYFLGELEKQRKIDIDNACKWLSENIDEYLYNRVGFEEHIPTCGDALFVDFRKEMEE